MILIYERKKLDKKKKIEIYQIALVDRQQGWQQV